MASELTAARQEMRKTNCKLEVVQHQMGDLQKQFTGMQDQLSRMETRLQRFVNSLRRTTEPAVGRGAPNLRPSGEPTDLLDLVQPAELEMEMTRRLEDLRQIVATGWEQDQLPNVSTPEGNFSFPSTGFSVVATGWDQDPSPHSSLASPTWNHQKPNQQVNFNPSNDMAPSFFKSLAKGPILDSPEIVGGEPLVEALDSPEPVVGEPLVGAVVQKKETTMISFTTGACKYCGYKWVIGHKCKQSQLVNLMASDVSDEAPFDLTQLYVVGRADKRLRCNGLFWKLPPWPDFCTMNCDRFAQHCEYEVIEKFYSVKLYNHSFLYYIDKFEELIKIWPIMNEDYYAHVEGREIISNLSKVTGLATMSAAMRLGLDNIDEYVRNTIAWAFSVRASALETPVLPSFLKTVCQSKKSWQVRHIDIKVVQQTAILMGCTDLPHLKSLVEIFEHGLSDENPKVQTITALVEAVAPYGIESFNTVWKPPWKGIRFHLGKVLAAYLINEKHSIDEIKLTRVKMFELITSVKNGTIRGKMGKESLDELIAKGVTVKSVMGGRYLVQIADPAAIEAMDKKNNICNISVIALMDHGKPTLTDFLVTAAGIIAQEVAGDVRKANTRADEVERGITIKSTGISRFYEMTEVSLISYKSKMDGFDEKLLRLMASGSRAVLNPMAAMFGGIVGQEIMKACSRELQPNYQFFYFDSVESLPVELWEPGELKPENTRYAAQISVIVSKLRKKLEQATVFMGGSGAFGCEFLKNLALMGISYSPDGKLTVTDDDIMEKSNLSRQFLFRDWSNGQPKSIVADHCLTWARFEFEGLLEKTPTEVSALLSNPTGYAVASRTARDQLECVIECLHGEKCETFQDCITWTRLKFEDYLFSSVKQLTFTFPEDSMTNSGAPSCSAPKRFPRPLEFTPTESSQLNLVLTASILRAETFAIPIPHWAFALSSFTKMFASKFGVDDVYATAIRNCAQVGSHVWYDSKMIPTFDNGRFFAFICVFSRRVAIDKKDLYGKSVQRTDFWMGKTQESVEDVPCVSTIAMVSLDWFITKNETLVIEKKVDVCLNRARKFSVFPVVYIAIQCKVAANLSKFVKSWKRLTKSVPCIMGESGEYICVRVGKLLLEIGLKDLLKMQIGWMQILSKPHSMSARPDNQMLVSGFPYLRTSILLRGRKCQNRQKLKDWKRDLT